MTKPRKPESPEQALYDSIRELGLDPATGLDRWGRAAMLTGTPEITLRAASDDSRASGKLPDPARMDRDPRSGQRPRARRADQLACARRPARGGDRGPRTVDPGARKTISQRAILELKAAAAAYETGAGDPLAVHELCTTIADWKNNLRRVWEERERTARKRVEDQRPTTTTGPRLVVDRGA